ncbi:cell adhesion molecule 2 [Biomphalaria pfeifferi]|uniref:Cell adhesion molecule 2 n=1 Tax=Biomphalaria pfeifferi TaxID=112525 RepID=A0AAD8C1D3_BIOPF|nr:cell adhesion molecule 2 [Biomphalaria pfeifferi]
MPEYCLWFSAIITSAVLVQANAIGVTTSWIKDTMDSTTTTLQCSWTVESGESPSMLFFSPNDRIQQVYFYCAINTGPPYRCLRDQGTTAIPAVTTIIMSTRSTVLLPSTEANPPETDTGTSDFVTELKIAMPFILPPMIIAIFIVAIVLTVRGQGLQSKEKRHQSRGQSRQKKRSELLKYIV